MHLSPFLINNILVYRNSSFLFLSLPPSFLSYRYYIVMCHAIAHLVKEKVSSLAKIPTGERNLRDLLRLLFTTHQYFMRFGSDGRAPDLTRFEESNGTITATSTTSVKGTSKRSYHISLIHPLHLHYDMHTYVHPFYTCIYLIYALIHL